MVIVHYRILRPDGRTVWMRDTGFPIRAADGTQRNVAGVVQDITDIELARAALMDEKERFRTLAEGIPQLVWRSCDQGMWTWASPQWLDYTGQEQEASHGLGWLDVLHPDDREATLQAWQGANSRGSMESEYRVRRASDGAYRWHRSRSAPLFAEPGGKDSGRIVEWLGTSTDIDDLKRLQQRGEVLVAELQHRTRNLLAVVRAISARNFPRSPERDEFDGRLAALSRVQGFLSRSSGWSVPLADLVAAELAATGDGASAKVEVKGPPIDLPGDRVQPVALALHELATNAMKYGALRQPQGRLKVQWRLEQHDGAPRLVLDWRESGIEMPAEPPARRGYGTELIERALPYQLRAKTRLVFGHDGVHCTIMLPLHPDMGGTGQ